MPEFGPFYKVQLPYTPKEVREQEAAGEILAFSPLEIVQLWRKAREWDDRPLADLIKLGAFAGARIESLCTIRCDEVKRDPVTGILFIPFNDKTEGGRRDVPVHPAMRALVGRLIRESKDGYLVQSDAENQYKERGTGLGKRFGRLKTEMGFGSQHRFHSFRHTLLTMLLNAEVPVPIARDIAGHKGGLTYGRYGKTTLTTKLEKLERVVQYPDPEFMAAA